VGGLGVEVTARLVDSIGIRPGEASHASTTARWAAVTAVALLASACGAFTPSPAQLHARLLTAAVHRLPINGTLTVALDQPLDLETRLAISLDPPTPVAIVRAGRRLLVSPMGRWTPAQHYALRLVLNGTAQTLRWQSSFTVQPPLTATLATAGQAIVAGQTSMAPVGPITVHFPVPMLPASVHIQVNGSAVPASALSWSTDQTTASLTGLTLAPYQQLTLDVVDGQAEQGDVLTDPVHDTLAVLGLQPSNGSSGITPGFKTVAPIEVVIENSGPARPQSGLQEADIVFEYVSEYSVTRMTAFYFNVPPSVMGPVRSCRLINIQLNTSYDGVTMCSGVSPGTKGAIPTRDDPQHMRVVINDFDTGNHFYRVGFKFAPHNLYTDRGRALRWRAEQSVPTPDYLIDAPHADNGLGQPSGPPSVPLHGVTYAFNSQSQLYARYDYGSPFIDALTGSQIQVKNVVLIHVGYRMMPYLEDYGGGAHSVFYDLVGTGSAQIYSDGRVVNATWHAQWAHGPMYFTDAQGNFIRLNTGLTWVHVLGNGQNY
jgi:hypothetical protein